MENLISVVIPTMWKANQYFFPMLRILQDSPYVGEIILIDNNKNNAPTGLEVLTKLVHHKMDTNIFFNPSVNMGFKQAKNDIVCILNDDVVCDPGTFEFVSKNFTPDMGMICPYPPDFNKGEEHYLNAPPLELKVFDRSIDGLGCIMFLHKQNFKVIPDELVQHFGDCFMLYFQKKNNRINYYLHNIKLVTPMRVTTALVPEVRPVIQKDWQLVRKVFAEHGLESPLNDGDSPIV